MLLMSLDPQLREASSYVLWGTHCPSFWYSLFYLIKLSSKKFYWGIIHGLMVSMPHDTGND